MEQFPAKRKFKPLLLIAAIVLLIIAALLTFLVSRMLERRSYRLNYPEEIKQYAAEYTLDPYLIAAVIHCESGNRPEVVSHAGAVGLMQIMPDTGEWIAGKFSIKNFTPEQLKQPALNIRFGCWYLRFLMDRYEGNSINVTAAYNAGHGNVDKWLADKSISPNGRLENIPFKETCNYVERVQRAHEKYKTLYKDAF